jgi:hypothetical protein
VNELWTLDRHQHCDKRPVAVADQVRWLADHGLQEGDGVVGHELVGDRALDVGGVAMATPLGGVEVEVFGQRGKLRLQEPRVDQPACSSTSGWPWPCSSYQVLAAPSCT